DISPEKAEEYVFESDCVRAKSRALWLLDRYTYTERRLYEKLVRAGFGEKAVGRAIARLKELGLIDDKNLASLFAEDLARHGTSKRAAYSKLLAKGFDAQTVKEALDGADFDEAGQISALLEGRYARLLQAGNTDKVYAALIRKGFSYGAVREALKKYSDELKYNEDV
ncbi:MAG: regulatory protein RecX, partial [Clostridia bacterium]|nr:regulatory protein RecX [Clostridia bacterium]